MQRLPILLGLSLLVFCGSSQAAQKKPFTIEDYYRIKGVSDPQISPDGTQVAFVLRHANLAKAKRVSHIYLMDVDGQNKRPLTTGEKSASSPRWSPDGQQIAFVSSRSGSSQIWLISPRGGEARALTSISTGVSGPVWSPDGRFLAFETTVFPEHGADDEANKLAGDRLKNGPIKARVADRLLYRHWSSWKDWQRPHTFVVDSETGKVRDLTPGDFDAPVFQLGGQTNYAFSPDSRELCFASNHDVDEARSTNADIWTVSVDGGEPVNITEDNPAFDGQARYSPDGQWIAYRTQKIPGYEADKYRLALYHRETGTHRVVTELFDSWVDDFEWLHDSRHIAFVSPDQGSYPLFLLDIQTSSIRKVGNVGSIDAFDISEDGRFAIVSRRRIHLPSELVRIDMDSGKTERLTHENRALEDEIDIRPAESLWIEGADGRPMQMFLIKPHGFNPNKKYPLILNVHGGPQGMWADSFRGDWQVYPGAGYVLAFPNPHGSTGFGQDYTHAISKDWAGRVMEDVFKAADYLAELPYVDADNMGAMGWSWGGYAMMWIEGRKNPFKCLAAMMGVYDLPSMYGATEELWFPTYDLGGEPWNSDIYRKQSPSRYVKNFKTPCLVITGEKDYRVPYTQSLQFFTHLQVMNVPSRLIVFENAGHWPAWYEMALYYNAHLEWFHRYLGGGPAPWDTEKMARNEQVFD